jgi:NADH-quinone oxidoreductase subunit M
MTIPFLKIIFASPIVAALIMLLFMKNEQATAIKVLAAVATGISLLASAYIYVAYDVRAAGFQFEELANWVPQLGIGYHLGVDGISVPMLLLTGLASFCGVLISWRIDDRPREFFAFFMLLAAGVYGVFMALDLFLLFFFYELAIFPMYILIATWGWKVTRVYASMKLTLYILIGSVIALVGVIAMVLVARSATGEISFDVVKLIAAQEAGAFEVPVLGNVTFARLWFPFIFLGFGVLAGVFPFHNWSPDGHVAAPTAVSMIHAGVLMKMGAYAALRVGVQLLPSGAVTHLPWIVFLSLINVVYGSMIALVQRDFKYVIGFSSVSHMGLVSMGFATQNIDGMTGAGMQMFSHGVMTALFFAAVGMVYDRTHTRDIPSLGGMWTKMPVVALAFIVGGLTSMGMPGLSGFVAELPILVGVWNAGSTIAPYYAVIAILAATGIIVTAAYVLRVVQSVFFGEFDESKYHGVGDVTLKDKAALGILTSFLILIGVFPSLMAPLVTSGMAPIVQVLGG